MARIATLLKFTALPGKRDELVAAFQDEAAQAERNAGIELYLVHTAYNEPDAVYLYIAFVDEVDEQEYVRGTTGAQEINWTDILVPGPPGHVALVPQGGKGVPQR